MDSGEEVMEMTSWGLVLIPILAVMAPLLARALAPIVRISIVVFELLLGILIGPSVLGWVGDSEFVEQLSDFGLAMLFFMAGNEIRLSAIRGRNGRRASLGWLIGLAAGVAIGFLIEPSFGAVVIGIALCSTALGAIMPILRDAGELPTRFGGAAVALGAVGEFGPLIAISIFLGASSLGVSTIVLGIFIAIAMILLFLAARIEHSGLHRIVTGTLHTSGQFAIRVVIFIVAALVVLSIVLDLDMLLGAFVAGLLWQVMMRQAPKRDRAMVDSKLDAIAFGFLVPIFYINTGVSFDLEALTTDSSVALLVPIFLVLLLIVRGVPSMLAAPKGSSTRDRAALGLLGATGLPIIVAVTAIGLDSEYIDAGTAAALVGAGLLSVLLFPVIAMTLRGDAAQLQANSTGETKDDLPNEPHIVEEA
ncbi:cation:proton antiporter [Salinibacterium sp. PAMC 21357]|uniref:cation:proton antiporter n=1 Tax=Salinibacterium sp. PAMC 21357 TaxID=1112215 RepID=UPI001ED93DB8|nr:cation:proton antiporter [Salinibacterium sp. PAMC 21357]